MPSIRKDMFFMSSCLKRSNKPYSLTKPLLLLTRNNCNVVSFRSMHTFIRSIHTFTSFDMNMCIVRCEVTKVAVSDN